MAFTRINIYMHDTQVELLKQQSAQTNIPVSVLVREAVDAFLVEKDPTYIPIRTEITNKPIPEQEKAGHHSRKELKRVYMQRHSEKVKSDPELLEKRRQRSREWQRGYSERIKNDPQRLEARRQYQRERYHKKKQHE